MALVKCKECGSEVSTKAKKCPKCGAKAPTKTSLLSWLIAAVVLIVVFNTITSDPSSTSSSSSEPASSVTSSSPPKSPPVAKKPEWSNFDSEDEMTGEKSSYAISPSATTTREMSFPYGGTEARLAFGCDASSEWAYINFTQAPNLNDGDMGDGYRTFKTRVRWGENISTEVLLQRWGAESMHFRNESSVISKISGSASAMVELNWHGQGSVRFPFSLNGSSKAIQEARRKCATY